MHGQENHTREPAWGTRLGSTGRKRSLVKKYVPKRGDLVWINFTPQAGHEQGGRRPALVVSDSSYNKSAGLALLCPVTSRVKGYPFEVELPANSRITGVVLADHI